LFHATGSFLLLFGIGTAAALVSGICVWGAGRRVA
jgi:hypothetical protein